MGRGSLNSKDRRSMPNQIANEGSAGIKQPGDASTEFNVFEFIVESLLSKKATATLVQVKGVTNAGGVSPVGYVDILPLVNQIDGAGNAVPHGVIYHCPYQRLQGGGNAVIIDPQVGDIGIAIFADRDISSVAANKGQANPGSRRRFDMADGLYIGGVLNGTPTQYVEFSTAGIKIHSPTAINLEAPDVQINAATVEINASSSTTINTPTFTVNGATVLNGTLSQGRGSAGGTATMLGPITVANDVTAGSVSLMSHKHSDPQGGTTGGPV
jgi:hypothetical protein